MYRNRFPSNDDAYFENMTRVIFLAGLSWRTIDRKWPNFKKAFKEFSIDEVAKFDERDVKELMNNKGIVRNLAKITATIDNAKQFQIIREEYGSFKSYLDSLDKSNNYILVVKELGRRFRRLGPSSARIFLYSVGEDVIPEIEK
jgi:3-methyladenine DNA glycosylase Tag